VTKPVRRDLEFNGVNPGIGHGEVAGFEASVVLNRMDFGIDIDMPLPSGGAVVGRIAIINARLTLRAYLIRSTSDTIGGVAGPPWVFHGYLA
jgi:hypothetical protein